MHLANPMELFHKNDIQLVVVRWITKEHEEMKVERDSLLFRSISIDFVSMMLKRSYSFVRCTNVASDYVENLRELMTIEIHLKLSVLKYFLADIENKR